MKKQHRISEPDLLLYYFAVEKKYFDLFELYGLLANFCKCAHCGETSNAHYRIMGEIVDSMGGRRIPIPKRKELQLYNRDIIIWKGLARGKDNAAAVAEEYMKRYELSRKNIWRIRDKVQRIVDKFCAIKKAVSRK